MASTIQFCDVARNNQGSICLDGIRTFFKPDFIPGMFSFGLVVTISDYDWNIPHKIRLDIQDPDCKEILVIEEVSPILEFEENLPEKFRALIGAWQLFNVKIQLQGTYKVRLYMDGVLDGEQEVYFSR